jgi:hypothetical protein
MATKNEVLDFYQKFSEYNDMANISYIQKNNDIKSRGLRQIKLNEINYIKEDKIIEISIKNQIASFLEKKLSQIIKAKNSEGEMEDQNKLFLGFAYMKVYFESKDSYAYFPLLMIDISDRKEEIFLASKTGVSSLKINLNEEIFINEEVLKFFFNLTYEENGKEFSEYIATTLEDFIPEDFKNNVANILEYTYGFFKKKINKEFEILFPNPTKDNSAVFMFFNSKSNFKLRKEYENMKEENLPLVEEYLEFEQENNSFSKLDNSIWYGSLTKEYPLGHGQAIVLQESQRDTKIVPVVGGPGTGKTTLFLSVISNLVTKRAISNIFDNKDYNNLILVTSTSNKAVENVYKSLKKGFKHGFVYVGGNTENREASKEEVREFLSIFMNSNFSKDSMKKHEDSVKRIVKFIEKRKIAFLEILENKYLLSDISSFKDLADKEEDLLEKVELLNEKEVDKSYKYLQDLINSLNLLIDNKDFKSLKDFLNFEEKNSLLSKLKLIKRNEKQKSFFKKIFHSSIDLDKYELNIELKTNSDIFTVLDIVEELVERKVEFLENLNNYITFEKLKFLSLLSLKYNDNQKLFNQLIKYDNFGEYFRLNLYSLNYKLYISSYNYLYQKMLSQKEEVMKAISYLLADNQYKYLIDNFGKKKKDIERFLKLFSLAYPVSTSTLAAIGSMFQGIFPNKNTTYNTILADESGMISVHDILPALRRAEKAIIVGDPKQLEPIVSIEEVFLEKLNEKYEKEFWEEYSPTSVSSFHRAAGTLEGGFRATGRGIMLDEHRRCQPQIAELFIDIAEYSGLVVKTPMPKSKAFNNINNQGLMFFDCKNIDQNGFKKENFSEIKAIEILINRLEKAGYNPAFDIGIITPYKQQEEALIKSFGSRLRHSKEEAKIGTVHKFQGVEYKVIIFSTVVSRSTDSLNFINNSPSMINVAVSRAKDAFIVVGDYSKLTEDASMDNYAGRMAKFINKKGIYVDMK